MEKIKIENGKLYILRGKKNLQYVRATKGCCKHCGDEIIVANSDLKRHKGYCAKCVNYGREGHVIKEGELLYEWGNSKRVRGKKVKCDACGKEWIMPLNRDFSGLCNICSVKKIVIIRRYGKENPAFKFGHKTYRLRAFEIFDPICMLCKATEGLQVHHIDGNNKNNPLDGSNWMVVCPKCHRKFHKRKQARGKGSRFSTLR